MKNMNIIIIFMKMQWDALLFIMPLCVFFKYFTFFLPSTNREKEENEMKITKTKCI